MKKANRTYFILSYLFFIYPPFILSLVEIYSSDFDQAHITALIMNIVLISIIALVCVAFISTERLHKPTIEEVKYLAFGFFGNIVSYLYTMQYLLHIEDIINIYLVLLSVLVVYYILISKKLQPLELWLLMPVFLIFDYLVTSLRRCGWESQYDCYANTSYDPFLKWLFFVIIMFALLFYVYRILLYRAMDVFKYINIIIILYLIYVATFVDMASDFTLTMMILYPFFFIVDVIVKLVNKTFKHTLILYYIRTLIIFIVFITLGVGEYYVGRFRPDILMLLVVITYASLGISIYKFITKTTIKDLNPFTIISTSPLRVSIREISESDSSYIKEHFGEVVFNHIHKDRESYSICLTVNQKIVGLISTYRRNLDAPLEHIVEAYIDVIEVDPNHRNKGYATLLIEKTERYFQMNGVRQIRAWSSTDKYEALHLWEKLNYTLSEALIHLSEHDINVSGFYATKKL